MWTMARKTNSGVLFLVLAACMIFVISPASAKTPSDIVKMNVFERFRNEMTIAHDLAAPKFMSAGALAKWNGSIMPYFGKRDRQLSHFFAFSMLVPKINQDDFYVSYFNPWIDGVLLTKWRKTGNDWKMEDFYFASGERVRREITPQFVVLQKHAVPVWLRYRGPLLKGLYQYYTDMSAWLLGKDVGEYMSWLALSETERKTDLTLLRLRMRARLETAIDVITKTNSGSVLSGVFSKLKYDALTKDKRKLAAYSRHADMLADLPAQITKTWRENWYLKTKNVFTVILSSPIRPRLFLFINVFDSGKIQGVLLGDLEVRAAMLRKAAAKAQTVSTTSRPPAKKVQKYKTANGDEVEITTERRGGKVIMTTRINGRVTETLAF